MNIVDILRDIKSGRKKKVILDTDAYNEADDQYALAYCRMSGRIDLAAVNAAPFANARSDNDYALGEKLSYGEIKKVLSLIDPVDRDKTPVFRGSTVRAAQIGGEGGEALSHAAENLIRCVRESDDAVYVLAIGAATNIASALAAAPDIKDNMAVIWLAGNEFGCSDPWEFNLMQDVGAGQILLESGAALMLCPAWSVVSALSADDVLVGELKGANPVCDYLCEITEKYCGSGKWKKIIWDIAAPAILDLPECADIDIVPAPELSDSGEYSFERRGHDILYLRRIDRDAVFKRAWEVLKGKDTASD